MSMDGALFNAPSMATGRRLLAFEAPRPATPAVQIVFYRDVVGQ